jgi:lambda repressor-like predicted transcriptional regulator
MLDAKHKSSDTLGMDKPPLAKRAQILNLLCEGMSMRAVSRVADVSFNTVAKALVDAGTVCAQMHDELVRDVKATRIQCDEIWALTVVKLWGSYKPMCLAGDAARPRP